MLLAAALSLPEAEPLAFGVSAVPASAPDALPAEAPPFESDDTPPVQHRQMAHLLMRFRQMQQRIARSALALAVPALFPLPHTRLRAPSP